VFEKAEPQNQKYYIKDRLVSGLSLCVYPTSVKTFLLTKKVNGRVQRIKIGRFPDISIEQARKKAIELKSIIALGGDPGEKKKALKDELTFRELYQKYYDGHAAKFTKNPDHNKQMLEFHIFPKIGNSKLRDVTKERLIRIHTDMGENRGKGTANRVIHIVAAVFNYGIKNNLYEDNNPCIGLKKYKINSRDRFLNHEELKLFFMATEKETELFRDFFLLLLYTGARKSNVLTMKWADIDFNLKRWRIPEHQSKNKDVNIVLLSDLAIEILKRRYQQHKLEELSSLYVFPGESKEGCLKEPKRAFERIRKRMNVEDFRMHDLRRTFGSYMAISGASLPIIGKALNHKSQVSTAIYARLSQDPVFDAVNKTTKLLLALGDMR
jgi:integrase